MFMETRCSRYQTPAASPQRPVGSDKTDARRTQSLERLGRARQLAAEGKHDKAIAELRAVVAIDRECGELHYQLGVQLVGIKEYDEAELRFSQAVSIDPDDARAWLGLALCAGVHGRADQALRFRHRAHAIGLSMPAIDTAWRHGTAVQDGNPQNRVSSRSGIEPPLRGGSAGLSGPFYVSG
jgi:tetratricopeptide (TPR) repeat protein